MVRPLIIGNWKMNKTPRETQEYLNQLRTSSLNPDVELAVAPSFTSLPVASQELKGSDVCLCAQNMHYESSGAYTGEVSPLMLLDLGVRYVILGHSERRQYFSENDLLVNKKIRSAMIFGLSPVICVGESLKERESGQTDQVIQGQVKGALQGISNNMNNKIKVEQMVFAYEPVWAIGTGKTCAAHEANRVCAMIKAIAAELYNAKTVQDIRVLYGGSVKSSNIRELMAQESINGALVGGASLDLMEFCDIVNY